MSQQTLFQAIKADHEEIYQYHDQYKRACERSDTEAQERWSNQLRWEIARHSIGEEIVVYPLFQKHLGEKGAELADHDRADHQKVKDALYKLESMKVGSDEFDALLNQMMAELHEHADSEETEDLPLLESKLSDELNKKSAKSFQRTKKFVPTRSHPSAPNKPPGETLAGLLAAPMDKLKDIFASFPTDEEMQDAKADLKTRDHDAAASKCQARGATQQSM